MLLHLSPRIIWPYKNASILDLEINPLGLHLVGGVDLITGRPYPNKRWKVACRKTRHNKAYNGLLLETSAPVDQFETVARWAIEAETVVTHHIRYKLLDHDFDAASDNPTLWYGTGDDLGNWSNRWPGDALDKRRLSDVIMNIVPQQGAIVPDTDTLDTRGWIVRRRQSFTMPTIERGRLSDSRLVDRLPPLDTALYVVVGDT